MNGMHLVIGLILLALGAGVASGDGEEAVSGYLTDMSCAMPISTHPEDIPDFGYSHDHDCLRKEACAKSGYAVLTTENRLLAFDPAGNRKAAEWLRTTDRQSDFQVIVRGIVNGDRIAVSTITPVASRR
jgi:hypothetical protein